MKKKFSIIETVAFVIGGLGIGIISGIITGISKSSTKRDEIKPTSYKIDTIVTPIVEEETCSCKNCKNK